MEAAINKYNVTGLHKGSVYEDIQAFLLKCKKKNESTADVYERGLKMFFRWYKDKDINKLTEDDIQVKNSIIIRYQDFLETGYNYAPRTINKYLSAIFSLYEFLEVNGYPINAQHVKVDFLKAKSNKHGEMNDQEAKEIRDFVKNTRSKGLEKAAFIRMGYTTSFRKSAILNIGWDDIKKHPYHDYYEVTVIDKGDKERVQPISEEFYNELLQIKEQKYYRRYNDNKVFHLSKTTIQNMFDDINEHFEFNGGKKVVPHSLRNVMAGWIEESGGKIEEIKDQLGHSSFDTYFEHYQHSHKDLSNSPSLRFENEISNDIFNELNREEFLELIMSQKGGVLMQLKLSAKKMIENKEDEE
ncbi:Site-specific recombinase XerD [Paenibacillus sophorae]|uniref:Site-specific recombinase XerD n=1 Tax=Paenibacillus sophorae TaxID=1333845 RepID=A0A1H8H214_9BACL|nr:tyrosine-type recombinase/integrase [Paenibacillus sophorae]QWU14417.1 tyrosine-type recombinase/integrase [Paenibacillus sophorae]SEN50175.1 Site-specific recombinase XerD [Paenibacillus sophorae]